MLSNTTGGYAWDEEAFHLPAVRQIRSHWPRLDLERDALSAVSPVYHYVLATVSIITGPDRQSLRFFNWLVSLAVLLTLWLLFPASTERLALAALLPLACSNFFVKSAAWIVTDNPPLLCIGVMLALVFSWNVSLRSILGAAALAGGATALRQLHVWTAAPIALSAFLTASWSRRILVLLASFLPVAVLVTLVWHWNGLVPPAWRAASYQADQSYTASLCYILAVLCVLGPFYWLATAVPRLSDLVSLPVLLGGLFGLVLAIVGPTDYSVQAGRWGGYLWSLAGRLPAPGGRSVVFLILAPCGGALLALLTAALHRYCGQNWAILWLGSFSSWALMFLPNRQVFHRYFEPMILIFLVLWLYGVSRHSRAGAKRLFPLFGLAAVQVVVTIATAWVGTFWGNS